MGTVWVYPAEILPLKIRAKGAALAAAADFLGNFLVRSHGGQFSRETRTEWLPEQVVEITPPALDNIKWRTYIIFAVFNVVIAAIVWACYPETSGIPLESIDDMFRAERSETSSEAEVVKGSWTSAIQWSAVPRADLAVRRAKAERRNRTVGCSAAEEAAVPSSSASGTNEKAAEVAVENREKVAEERVENVMA